MTEKKIIITPEKIAARVKELGTQITRDYANKDLLLVGVLNGAFIFTADLARTIELPLEIDFIKVASYGENTSSSGSIALVKDVEARVAERDILIVEDIVDTGNTLVWLIEHLVMKNPRSLKFCALIDKGERRLHNLIIDYKGFDIPHGFLIGYGLDHAGQYRHLSSICELVKP